MFALEWSPLSGDCKPAGGGRGGLKVIDQLNQKKKKNYFCFNHVWLENYSDHLIEACDVVCRISMIVKYVL